MDLAGKKVLVVASTGGHLTQAVRWYRRLRLHPDSVVVTFESDQSRSMLADTPHVFVPYVAPRDYKNALLAARALLGISRRGEFEAVLSTGAGVAISALPAALVRRIPFYFIESVSRFNGPSLTGRLLSFLPKVRRYAQHDGYGSRWSKVESLLGDYTRTVGTAVERPLRIFVTLGTIKPYRFDRLVDRVLALSEPDDEITWQLGATTRTDLPGRVRSSMTAPEFDSELESAHVVVTHAGVGTLLRVVEVGKVPMVAARLSAHGEHVDDHQLQALSEFTRAGVAHDLMTADRNELLKTASEEVVVG